MWCESCLGLRATVRADCDQTSATTDTCICLEPVGSVPPSVLLTRLHRGESDQDRVLNPVESRFGIEPTTVRGRRRGRPSTLRGFAGSWASGSGRLTGTWPVRSCAVPTFSEWSMRRPPPVRVRGCGGCWARRCAGMRTHAVVCGDRVAPRRAHAMWRCGQVAERELDDRGDDARRDALEVPHCGGGQDDLVGHWWRYRHQRGIWRRRCRPPRRWPRWGVRPGLPATLAR